MNRNSALIFPGALVATPGSVPWVNPGTRQVEWIPAPVVDEFVVGSLSSGPLGWLTTQVLNGGTIAVGAGDAGHPGTADMATSAATNGVANIRTSNNIIFGQAGKKHRLLMVFKTPAILSSAGDAYVLAAGFSDALTAGPVNSAALIEYSHSINSGNWNAKVNNGGAVTTATGGTAVAVVANTYYWFYLEFDSNIAKFWVAADVAATPGTPGPFTYLGACATNIPNATNKSAFQHSIIKSAGTTSVTTRLDKVVYSI
jgi:hypothetical protein